jgi:hypothetical protein
MENPDDARVHIRIEYTYVLYRRVNHCVALRRYGIQAACKRVGTKGYVAGIQVRVGFPSIISDSEDPSQQREIL